MVEKAKTGVNKGNVVLLAGINHRLVVGRATRTGNVLDARLEGPVDVVAEGEEGVRTDGHLLQLADPFTAFSLRIRENERD